MTKKIKENFNTKNILCGHVILILPQGSNKEWIQFNNSHFIWVWYNTKAQIRMIFTRKWHKKSINPPKSKNSFVYSMTESLVGFWLNRNILPKTVKNVYYFIQIVISGIYVLHPVTSQAKQEETLRWSTSSYQKWHFYR